MKVTKKITRKFEWLSHLGQTVTIEGCADEHLANIIQFLTQYDKFANTDKVLKEMFNEARRRGLSAAFLERAPFPYRDGKGNYVIWDYNYNRIKIVGSYLRG